MICRQKSNSACCWSLTCVFLGKCDLTCMRFMASRIWSRWWAELSASRRMSVNLSSFSLSSFFSWRTISASASVHSHSLQMGLHTGRRRGSPQQLYKTHTHSLEWRNTHLQETRELKFRGKLESVEKTAATIWRWVGNWGIWDSESFPFTILHVYSWAVVVSCGTLLAQWGNGLKVAVILRFTCWVYYCRCSSSRPILMMQLISYTTFRVRCNPILLI